MDELTAPVRAVFIVWGPPHKGPRSRVLAGALGVPVVFLADTWRAGLRDPLKYPRLIVRTVMVFARLRPRVVLVQSPPTLAVWLCAVYAWLRGGSFLIDAHSDAFQRERWVRPRWLNRRVARRALTTIVTDEYWAAQVRAAGAAAMVVPDIPVTPSLPATRTRLPANSFHLLVVNTWAADEPLAAVIAAARELPQVTFHVTGADDARVAALGSIPENVRFTGFLPTPDYIGLMRDVHAVACLTQRDHTMQRGACEALALSRPIITSDWPLLRSYFDRGTIHVDSDTSSIRDGIVSMIERYDLLVAEVDELRRVRAADWEARRARLLQLVEAGGRRSPNVRSAQ